MSTFSELIKTFSRTRDYVRDFFIYGCKVRDDFKHKSSRTYDDERRRTESWLGDYINHDDSKRGRQISMSVDSGHITENPLYQAYYAKSFTDNDIKLHFFLIDLLANGKRFTSQELTNLLFRKYDFYLDEKTVRTKLKEYSDEGLFICEKEGRTPYYRISPDTFDEMSGRYPGLKDAVRFFSEIQPFGVIGNSILKSCDMQNDRFIMKHNYIARTLEDDILLDILEAMRSERSVKLKIFPARLYLSENTKELNRTCIPMKISTSAQTGRRYLIVYTPSKNSFDSIRLDYIKEVKPDEPCPEYSALTEKLNEELTHVFGISFSGRNGTEEITPLHITMHISPEEYYIFDRVKREIRYGKIEQTGENTYLLTLDIYDPKEAVPWIRTFTGRIISVEGGTEEICRQFRTDTEAMAKLYGEVQA